MSCVMLSSHLYLGLPCDLLVRSFQLNIFLTVLVSGIPYTWPTQLSLWALMWLIIFLCFISLSQWYLPSPNRPYPLQGPRCLLLNGHQRLLPQGKATGREVELWPPSSNKIKNEWRYTSTSPICLNCVFSCYQRWMKLFRRRATQRYWLALLLHEHIRQIINCRITDPWRRQVQASCHWINTNCRSF